MKADKNLAVINKVLKRKEHLALLERNDIKKTAERHEKISIQFEDNYKEAFLLWEEWPDREALNTSLLSDIDRVQFLWTNAVARLNESIRCIESLEQRWKETIKK